MTPNENTSFAYASQYAHDKEDGDSDDSDEVDANDESDDDDDSDDNEFNDGVGESKFENGCCFLV